ncbi:MAG: TrkH family potassium uptake protein [Gammaproteobacteria bacterium]
MHDSNGFRALIYAVRWSVLASMGGRLALVLAVLCVPSLLVALWFREFRYVLPFIVVLLPLLLFSQFTRRLPEPHQVSRSEGFVLTCAAFVLTPIVLTFAMLPSGLAWADLLFEMVSAVTTTGLSTVAHVEQMDRTFLFTRAWMQWYGGLGIVVLSVTFLLQRSLAVSQLLEAPEGQGITVALGVYARKIFRIYLLLTLLAVGIGWFCFGDFFTGMVHGFSAISTGGFSSRDDSLMGLAQWQQLLMMLPAMLGALSLALYLRLWQRAWRAVLDNQELRYFLGLSLLVWLGLQISAGSSGNGAEQSVLGTLVLGLSALTTTGFANVSIATLPPATLVILLVAMFVGGCLGSTAGGFKVFRLLVLWQLVLATLRRASAAPHAVIEARIQGKVLTQEQIQLAMLTGSLLLGLIVLSWLIFLFYGYPPLPALFEVVSAVGTVGLSAGVTQADLPLALKTVLCIDMIAGRVEVVALLCCLYPGVWLGHRNPAI